MSDEDILPEEYALGVLSGAAHAAAGERSKTDPQFASRAESIALRLAGLAALLPDGEPDPSLWQRIERQLSQSDAAMILIRSGDEAWRERSPGVDVKILRWDETTGARAILLRMAPGATLPDHDHDGDEEVFMISGDLHFGEIELGQGDYLRMPLGSHHTVGRSLSGCQAIVITQARGA
jgi:quercetin dioxygenase-like cupin family protein